jgi:hypothetical protein
MYTLNNVQFNDAGTASGFFTLNTYGYVSSYDVVTTAGSIMGGATYATGMGQPSTTINPTNDSITFNLSGYDGFLLLTFADTLFPPSSTVDPIVTGGASFECSSYETLSSTCGSNGVERIVTSGSAIVPEPVSLAIFGTGLFGFGLLRRRKADGGAKA